MVVRRFSPPPHPWLPGHRGVDLAGRPGAVVRAAGAGTVVFAGTVAGTAPSTAHQIVLDFRPEARLSFAFEPPGYQLHYWREGIGLVTHTAAIGDWPGPYFYSKKSATD